MVVYVYSYKYIFSFGIFLFNIITLDILSMVDFPLYDERKSFFLKTIIS